jgi:hypothetical protein
MSNIEELKIEAEYALYQQELKAQGFREFYANSNGLSEFVLANYRLLLPGESISFDLKRVFKHNIGLGLQARVIWKPNKPMAPPKEVASFFTMDLPEDFPWGLFTEEGCFRVLMSEEELTDWCDSSAIAVYRPAIQYHSPDDGVNNNDKVFRKEGFYLRIRERIAELHKINQH